MKFNNTYIDGTDIHISVALNRSEKTLKPFIQVSCFDAAEADWLAGWLAGSFHFEADVFITWL